MKIGCQHKFRIRRHPQRNTKIENQNIKISIDSMNYLTWLNWKVNDKKRGQIATVLYRGDIFGKGHYLVD